MSRSSDSSHNFASGRGGRDAVVRRVMSPPSGATPAPVPGTDLEPRLCLATRSPRGPAGYQGHEQQSRMAKDPDYV